MEYTLQKMKDNRNDYISQLNKRIEDATENYKKLKK